MVANPSAINLIFIGIVGAKLTPEKKLSGLTSSTASLTTCTPATLATALLGSCDGFIVRAITFSWFGSARSIPFPPLFAFFLTIPVFPFSADPVVSCRSQPRAVRNISKCLAVHKSLLHYQVFSAPTHWTHCIGYFYNNEGKDLWLWKMPSSVPHCTGVDNSGQLHRWTCCASVQQRSPVRISHDFPLTLLVLFCGKLTIVLILFFTP